MFKLLWNHQPASNCIKKNHMSFSSSWAQGIPWPSHGTQLSSSAAKRRSGRPRELCENAAENCEHPWLLSWKRCNLPLWCNNHAWTWNKTPQRLSTRARLSFMRLQQCDFIGIPTFDQDPTSTDFDSLVPNDFAAKALIQHVARLTTFPIFNLQQLSIPWSNQSSSIARLLLLFVLLCALQTKSHISAHKSIVKAGVFIRSPRCSWWHCVNNEWFNECFGNKLVVANSKTLGFLVCFVLSRFDEWVSRTQSFRSPVMMRTWGGNLRAERSGDILWGKWINGVLTIWRMQRCEHGRTILIIAAPLYFFTEGV